MTENSTRVGYKDLLKSGKLSAVDRILISSSFIFAFLVLIALIVMLISSINTLSPSILLCGLAFLLLALGLVYYSLARLHHPKNALWFLYITFPISILVFILAVI